MRNKLLATANLAASILFLPTAFAADQPGQVINTPPRQGTETDRATPLEGTFVIVSGEKDGKPIDKERFEGSIVRITKDKMIGTDKDKKELFVAEYSVDATTKPDIMVRMISKQPKAGGESTGLIKRDGDTTTIVYNLPGAPAPTGFRTEKGQHLFVMKRLTTPESVQEKLKNK